MLNLVLRLVWVLIHLQFPFGMNQLAPAKQSLDVILQIILPKELSWKAIWKQLYEIYIFAIPCSFPTFSQKSLHPQALQNASQA